MSDYFYPAQYNPQSQYYKQNWNSYLHSSSSQ